MIPLWAFYATPACVHSFWPRGLRQQDVRQRQREGPRLALHPQENRPRALQGQLGREHRQRGPDPLTTSAHHAAPQAPPYAARTQKR